MIESVFLELSAIIILAVAVSGVMRLLRQPLIIGYIITGIIAGPFLLNIVRSTDMVAALSQFGVVFLLFIAGLSLNPRVMRSVGRVSLVTGVGQVLFTTLVGFLIAKVLGFPDLASMYIAIALTFSSTIIIIKLLSDKGDLQSLYGRISVGFLLVQDVIAILILMLISSSSAGVGAAGFGLDSALYWAGALAAIGLFSIFGLPRALKAAAKSQEFLMLLSLGWLLLMSVVFAYLNLSIEIGALLAGIVLSVSPYNHEIRLRMNVLRDFFIMFFFVMLGSQMVFMDISQFLLPIAVFSAFILLGNPLIVMILMGLLKYTKRNGFMSGLTVAQISEFSLILVALGVGVGHVSGEILSMMTAIGLITIFGSTYMIMNSNKLYSRISGYIGVFERGGKKVDEHSYHKRAGHEIILFGCNRIGFNILESIKGLGKRFLVVDYDPEAITGLARKGYECKYGDADDTELLDELDLSSARMVISTIPDIETNQLLIERTRERNRKAIIIVVSHQIGDALELYRMGATYVVMPYFLGGQHASSMVQKCGMDMRKFLREKEKHISHLKKRSSLKHEHPKLGRDSP